MNDVDDALTRLVAEADPLPQSDDPGSVDRAWAMVEAELFDDPAVTPFRRGSRWRRVGVVGVVAAVGLAASAGTVYLSTRTGEHNPPESVAAGGPGENYRLNGTDFAAELAKLASDVPYPNAAARTANLAAIVRDASRDDESSQASTGALRAEIARGAICAWTLSWQSDHTTKARRTATAALRGAMSWPAVTDVDPKPAIDGYRSDGGAGPTVFGHLPGIIEAAINGDEAGLAAALDESAYCAVTDRPAVAANQAAAPTGPAGTPAPTTRP
ncbi:MAG: hypothetical protein QM695_05640 [Micropruina sp.]